MESTRRFIRLAGVIGLCMLSASSWAAPRRASLLFDASAPSVTPHALDYNEVTGEWAVLYDDASVRFFDWSGSQLAGYTANVSPLLYQSKYTDPGLSDLIAIGFDNLFGAAPHSPCKLVGLIRRGHAREQLVQSRARHVPHFRTEPFEHRLAPLVSCDHQDPGFLELALGADHAKRLLDGAGLERRDDVNAGTTRDIANVPCEGRTNRREDDGWDSGLSDGHGPMPHPEMLERHQNGIRFLGLHLGNERVDRLLILERRVLLGQRDPHALRRFGKGAFVVLTLPLHVIGRPGPAQPIRRFVADHRVNHANRRPRPEPGQVDVFAQSFRIGLGPPLGLGERRRHHGGRCRQETAPGH